MTGNVYFVVLVVEEKAISTDEGNSAKTSAYLEKYQNIVLDKKRQTADSMTSEACTTKLVQLNLDMLELAGWRNPKHTRSR